MNSRSDGWAEQEVAFLRSAWEAGTSTDNIARMLGRTREAVDGKRKKLQLCSRDVNHIRRAKLLAMAQERANEPRPRVDRDDEHWRRCLAAGGFPVSVKLGGKTVWVTPALEAAE